MILRRFSLYLIAVLSVNAERIEIECEFIEKTDRGLQCEFNNVTSTRFSELLISEKNTSIDAVSFRQSDLFSVPVSLFEKFTKLKHLDVEFTSLKDLKMFDFINANSLKYFLARFNDISSLPSNVFSLCPLFKFIVLQWNKISIIDSNAFNELVNLEALYLDHNQIKILPPRVFLPLINMVHISLAFNNISNIPDDLFTKNEKLETLNFGRNLLTAFDEKHFDSLHNLERVQLNHNKLKTLGLRSCKSSEINVDKNELESLELNKWTRFLSAWGNPIKLLTLHEHYGTGRSYNFSFEQVREITFFVNDHCCTVENLENFEIMIHNFGDLSQKNFNVSEWTCEFKKKDLVYQTPTGTVVDDVCVKTTPVVELSTDSSISDDFESGFSISVQSTSKPGRNIVNPEDLIDSDETTKPRESLEDTSDSAGMFIGMEIETLPEKRTTTRDPDEAFVEEIFPTTTPSDDTKVEKGIFKTVKTKVVGWKNKAVRKWNDWFG